MARLRSLKLAIAVLAIATMASASARADIVTDNLLLHFDAGNAGNGIGVLGSGASWIDLSGSATNHDASLVGSAAWAGTGATNDPFVVRLTQTSPLSFPSSAQGYAAVSNSGAFSDLDTTVFTYEVWAKITGPGTGQGNSSQFFEQGALISHAAGGGGGNGMINYTSGGSWQAAPDSLYGGDSSTPVEAVFPNSNGIIGDGLMHHIVLTRSGDGAADTTWYLDGILKGSFQTASSDSDAQLLIGARHRQAFYYDQGANADIAQVRVYGVPLTGAEVLQNFSAGLTPASVPEPSALVLLVVGLAGSLVQIRKKSRS
jgi:hypothetical protein